MWGFGRVKRRNSLIPKSSASSLSFHGKRSQTVKPPARIFVEPFMVVLLTKQRTPNAKHTTKTACDDVIASKITQPSLFSFQTSSQLIIW